MKKILSIILATAMLISLIPSAFATIDETTGLNKLTYNFNYSELGLSAAINFTSSSGLANKETKEKSYKIVL